MEIPVTGVEAETAAGLDWAHNDPFDRLLVALAQTHGLTIVTADAKISDFPGVARLLAT